MSIIDDALKKTQEALNSKDKSDMSRVYAKLQGKKPPEDGLPDPNAPPDSNIGPKSKGKNKILIVIVIVLIAITILVTFFGFGQQKIAQIKSKNPFVKLLKKNKPKAKTYKKGELVVNGVMKTRGKMVVLINGKIYETGQSVQGKEIVSISMTEVKLNDSGTKITLEVKN